MKRSTLLIITLAIIAIASGILMSKARWIAKVGITFLHKEYNFTKVWWQGAAAIFGLFLVLHFVHSLIHRHMSPRTSRATHSIILLAVAVGFYFTYHDFATDFSHHLLGWRFHYGFYLFWLGWAVICLYFIFKKNRLLINSDRKAPAAV
ncbi:MAG: hypothetical protein V4649_19175 [Bacteroidota bacterium]